jgi:hypothetical protein
MNLKIYSTVTDGKVTQSHAINRTRFWVVIKKRQWWIITGLVTRSCHEIHSRAWQEFLCSYRNCSCSSSPRQWLLWCAHNRVPWNPAKLLLSSSRSKWVGAAMYKVYCFLRFLIAIAVDF